MSLSESEIQRYARHILLPDIGGVGQARLRQAAVAVAVGPGTPAAEVAVAYLVAAGVGRVVLSSEHNSAVTPAEAAAGLMLGAGDIGRDRRAAIRGRARAINPEVEILLAERVAGEEPLLSLAPIADRAERSTEEPPLVGALIEGGAAACRLIAAIARGQA